MGIPDYQQRVIEEKDELDKKIVALTTFIGHNRAWDNLTSMEKDRMRRQRWVMKLYSEILAERIEAFQGE
jgi:uncharacterized protein YdcH (DUF465 family)